VVSGVIIIIGYVSKTLFDRSKHSQAKAGAAIPLGSGDDDGGGGTKTRRCFSRLLYMWL
jgi:hypothetical protein